MKVYLIIPCTLLAAAATMFGQATPPASAPQNPPGKSLNHEAFRQEAALRIDAELQRLRIEEKALGQKRAEISAQRHELDAMEDKMGVETGLNDKKSALKMAQAELADEEKIHTAKRSAVQQIEADINRIRTTFEQEHGIAPRREAIEDEQKDLDKEARHLNDRKRELQEIKRKMEHFDREHMAEILKKVDNK